MDRVRLRANGAQSVRIEGADLELTFEDGEEIRPEISATAGVAERSRPPAAKDRN
jgi:uncharacterized SAM-dependent methyltransferase